MRLGLTLLMLALTAAPSANAQLGMGGLGLPKLGGASMGNIAGLLGYCVKNRLLGSVGQNVAGGVLGQLTGRPEVTASPDYKAGLAGTLLGSAAKTAGAGQSREGGLGGALAGVTGGGSAGGGSGLSLDRLQGNLKNQMCDAVLKQARTVL